MTIAQLQTALAEVEAAMQALAANGQAYSIQGSHSVTSAEMRALQKRAATLEGRILRKSGRTQRHTYGVI